MMNPCPWCGQEAYFVSEKVVNKSTLIRKWMCGRCFKTHTTVKGYPNGYKHKNPL